MLCSSPDSVLKFNQPLSHRITCTIYNKLNITVGFTHKCSYFSLVISKEILSYDHRFHKCQLDRHDKGIDNIIKAAFTLYLST